MLTRNVSVRSETLRWIEYIVGIILSLVAITLLVIRATHAGPLWRDECDSVATATLPSFSEVLRRFQFDSFPLPFVLGLRGYITIFGNSDASLRLFGALVGVSLLLVGWWSASRLRVDGPVVFLALAVLNPAFLVWGTTVRGYGIGSVMIVFAFAATANFLVNGRTGNAFLMATAFVAAVQCLVSNTALVFAISLSAMGVCFWRGDRRTAVVIAGALGAAALSFLPYVATYFKMSWHVLLQTHLTFNALWEAFRDSLGARSQVAAVGWLVLLLLGLIPFLMRFPKRTVPPLPVFALLVALFSLLGTYIFLKLLSYPPHEWYFLPLVCLLAVAVDLASAILTQTAAVRAVRLIACLVVAGGMWWSNWPNLVARQSNVDLIANWLGSQAQAGDLIVVNPWFFGISFNRYYRGNAPWVTVPILSERPIHRYDLLREKMSEQDPLKDLMPRIESVLRNGGRVYLVGGVQLLNEGERALVLPPAPGSQYGWSYLPYVVAWSQQLGKFLQAHVETSAEVPRLAEHVNSGEDIPLWKVEGWHD
jgi:hypothetical protein